MTDFDTSPSNGVFDPSAVRVLIDAFEKAERHIDRLGSSALAEIDRDSVARRIVSEARGGEIQPDLVWRAAIARELLETRAFSSPAGEAATSGSSATPSEPLGDDGDPANG